jgi:hypothetical protein
MSMDPRGNKYRDQFGRQGIASLGVLVSSQLRSLHYKTTWMIEVHIP